MITHDGNESNDLIIYFSGSFPSWVISGYQIYIYIPFQIHFHHRLSQGIKYTSLRYTVRGSPGGHSGKESASEGETKDVGSIPGSGRSPGGGNSNPL